MCACKAKAPAMAKEDRAILHAKIGSGPWRESADRCGVTGQSAVDADWLAGMLEGLDALGHGGFLINRLRHVWKMNVTGRSLLSNGLSIINGCLTASNQQDSLDLATSVHAALVETSERTAVSQSVVLRRERGRPLVGRIVQIRRDTQAVLSDGLALVLVSAPEYLAQGSNDVIRKVFHLTKSEARAALCLADGKAASECSVELGYTIGTYRQLIKQVFTKTDTHRQSELATLLQAYRK